MNNTQGIPRIGLLPYSRADGSQYFPQDYLDAIEMVGAEMVPVMHDTPLDTLYPLVISMDAMIFSGGCDIDPVHYGCSRERAAAASIRAAIRRNWRFSTSCSGATYRFWASAAAYS